MKKIMFITSSMSSGGAERVISILSKKFITINYNVTILTTFTGEGSLDFYKLDPKVKRITLKSYFQKKLSFIDFFRKFLIFKKVVAHNKPDIIISFTSYINILSLISLSSLKIPIIVSERVDPFKHKINFFLTLLRPIVYKFAKKVICQTTDLSNKIKKSWNLKNVVTITNPLFEKIPNVNRWSQRKNIVLNVGRLENQKGHDMLIKAWSMLNNKKDWKLLIIGSGSEKKNLISMVKSLNLTKEIQIKSTTKNIWKEYNKSKIFILSSRYEGYPNVLIEAMAMGNAVISTDCNTGPREIIKKNGILTEINTQSVYKGLQSLIFDQKKQKKFYAEYLNTRKRFNSDKIFVKWLKIINQALMN